MSELELQGWLSRVKDFSFTELLAAQEVITQELKLKATVLETPNNNKPAKNKLDVVAKVIADNNLPIQLREELAAMNLFSDKALWKAARDHLPTKEAKKLSQLNYKQQKEGQDSLTQAEIQDLTALLYQYDRYILLRSCAAVLLKERGHDISVLVKQP